MTPLSQEAVRLRALGFHPIVERPNAKMPLEPGWQNLAYRATSAIRAAFDAAPEGHGIGTVTEGFIVIDCDVRPEKGVDGAVSLGLVELRLGTLPPTLRSFTPSGGMHLFFRLPPGVIVKNSVSKLGQGVDVRGTGGQVVLPPTLIDGKPYTWDPSSPTEMATLPEAWVDELRAQVEPELPVPEPTREPETRVVRRPDEAAFEAERRARYMATLTEPSVQGRGGNAVMMRAAFHAKEMSRSKEEALAALMSWNERCAQPLWSEAELARAIENSEATLGVGLDRPQPAGTGPGGASTTSGAPSAPSDQGVAWVESMGCYVARDRRTGTWALHNPLGEKAAIGALVARGMEVAGARALVKNWGVPMAERVDCVPGAPAQFTGDHGETVLNNWVPPRVVPQAGAYPTLDAVLAFLTCGDPAAKAWLFNWLAFAAQFPARPMRTVPVTYGAQRTGKSLLARAMTDIIGGENCASVRNEDIKSRFTSHFVNKLFVTVGEIEAGEVAHATSTLKYLTGEPTLMCEAKGATAFPVPNRIKMLATSNQTLPVTLEGEADSRWVLFKQLATPPPEYTAAMDALFDQATNAWSPRGQAELAGFAAALLAHPVDAALARTVYSNAARASAVEASRTSVEQFLDAVNGSSLDAVWLAHLAEHERTGPAFTHMDLPGRPDLTGVSALYATYRAFCRGSGLQALGTGRFPAELERHAPEWVRQKVPSSVLPTRPWAYSSVPREPVLRLQYLPLASRQLALAPAEDHPATAAAVAVMQETFGFETEEEAS